MKRAAISSALLCLFLLIPLLCSGQESSEPSEPSESSPDAQPSVQEPRVLDPRWPPLIGRLAEDGLDQKRLEQLFSDMALPWSPVFMAAKMHELYGSRLGAGAKVKSLPDRERPLPLDYMPPAASGLEGAKALLKDHAPLLAEVHKRYGVPPSLIAAILLLESNMGHVLGESLALHALASMAAASTPEHVLQGIAGYAKPQPQLNQDIAKSIRKYSARAYKELSALIHYYETNGIDILRVPGSVYGAIGLCQFMPVNIRAYGVDSNEKGVIDLFSLPDAAHSIGNYLKEHGFSEKHPINKQLAVLLRYNHSSSYAALALGTSYQLDGKRVPAELRMFSVRGPRKPWWPKTPPAYRLPPLGNYTIK